MTHPVVTMEKLTQLLDDLVDRVAEAEHAVALSPDGLMLATSRNVDPELAEQMSSVVAGLQALALAASRHSAEVGDDPGPGKVRQIIVQMHRAFLFITATPGGAVLAVRFTGEAADADKIAYEVALFAGRADHHLPTFPVSTQPEGRHRS